MPFPIGHAQYNSTVNGQYLSTAKLGDNAFGAVRPGLWELKKHYTWNSVQDQCAFVSNRGICGQPHTVVKGILINTCTWVFGPTVHGAWVSGFCMGCKMVNEAGIRTATVYPISFMSIEMKILQFDAYFAFYCTFICRQYMKKLWIYSTFICCAEIELSDFLSFFCNLVFNSRYCYAQPCLKAIWLMFLFIAQFM